MKSSKVYLRQDVQLEPLFNQWYAWSYLISPATSAMYIANGHLKIMQSFVSASQMHVSALKNPAMLGGPFINYSASEVGNVKRLMDKTVKENGQMLALAEAIKTLDASLKAEATGYSLEPLYQKIPDALKGYVELAYDLNNVPSVRFIEGLLYRSKYYNEASQKISLSHCPKDDRAFVFSTPRLEDDEHVYLDVPFRHQGIDELFKMRRVPQSLDYIRDVLHVADRGELFSSFFTEEEPERVADYDGDDVRIRYYGHACILIETRDTSILVDPVLNYKQEDGYGCYTFSDLPEKIDYVLITHNHQDHCMFETLLQLRHQTRTLIVPKNNGGSLADPSLRLMFEQLGFEDVRELDEMQEIKLKDGTITGLPFFGEHADLNVRTKLAYLVNLKGRSVLCAADSDNIEPKLYEHIHQWIGDIDIVFLGMECDGAPLSWLYGPLVTTTLSRNNDQSRRLSGSNHEKAMNLINCLQPKEVYVYAMGQEPWLTYLTSLQYTPESRPIVESNKVVAECGVRGIPSERLFCRKEIFLQSDHAPVRLSRAS